jgi:hypothetical protein
MGFMDVGGNASGTATTTHDNNRRLESGQVNSGRGKTREKSNRQPISVAWQF